MGKSSQIPVDDILNILEFCLGKSYFSFPNNYYIQIFVTSMVSPLSGVIADLIMESDILRKSKFKTCFI